MTLLSILSRNDEDNPCGLKHFSKNVDGKEGNDHRLIGVLGLAVYFPFL